MTTTPSQELDLRLRAFVKAPTDVMVHLGLVNAFHRATLLASDRPYAITVEGARVVPVFTDPADLEQFKLDQASAQEENWVNRSALEVLREAIDKQLTGLVFNLKRTGDMSNSTLMKTSDMIGFVNHCTQILNLILGESNQSADLLAKNYLIPAYNRKDREGNLVRFFAMMKNPQGEHYIPVFTNMESFAKWYYDDSFGGKFRELKGTLLVWRLQDLQAPTKGEHRLEETSGLVINPFIEGEEILSWEQIKD